jgi:CRP-like cAMP-binding protein
MANFGIREANVSSDVARRKLDSLAALDPEASALVMGLSGQRQKYEAGVQIYGGGLTNNRPQIILQGWACHARPLLDGRNQILRFLIPGDAIGLGGSEEGRLTPSIVALTPTITADARPLCVELASGDSANASLAAAFARSAWLDEASLLDQILRLGRLTAMERMAHLLLELYSRLSRVGLTTGRRFSVPITQEVFADALGLSVVHINRTLQQLRRERLIEMRAGYVDLLEIETLKLISSYQEALPHHYALREEELGETTWLISGMRKAY